MGDYRLLVSKLDAYGKPSDRAYTLEVHIIPPWYYTPWAKGALCLALSDTGGLDHQLLPR